MVHHIIITGRAAIAASRNQTVGVSIAAAALPSSSIATFSLLKTNQTFNYDHRQFQLPTQHIRYFAADDATSANTIDQPEIKLYQYHICPFCNITKSLLKYSNLDYERIEVNPLTKAELKPWSGEYKKVPIAIIGDKQVNGSENILGALLDLPTVQAVIDKQSNDFSKSENAQKWTRFAIDDLAALLYPNICGTLRDSYDTFGYVKNVDTFSPLQQTSIQYIGALAMYFAASKVKSIRNITDEKAALNDALDRYEKEGLQNGKHNYSSGLSNPDMGDLAVFGVLYSVRGLNAHNYAIEQRGGAIKKWYDRMSKQVL